MGLWNFVKNAGSSLIGSAEAAEPDPEAANIILAEMEKLGLDNKGVDIDVKGDRVVVKGKAESAEIKEKIVLAAGNVKGIAQVETEDDDDMSDAVFHTVEKGDTLSAIAKKTLGSAGRYNEIFEANKPMLSHPDKIYPGQVLRIPGGKKA